MSDQLKLVITRQGLDECISAKSKGISLNLKWVSAGDTAYTPNPDQTRLKMKFNGWSLVNIKIWAAINCRLWVNLVARRNTPLENWAFGLITAPY